MIFLADIAKRLTIVHALAAMVTLGAVTHQSIVAVRAWRGRLNPRLAKIYGATGAISCALTVLLGGLVYPAYRYYVRGLYLDHCDVATSKLFDVKEDLAVFALLLAILVWVVARKLERPSPREHFELYTGASLLLASLVWFNALSGFFITLSRGLP